MDISFSTLLLTVFYLIMGTAVYGFIMETATSVAVMLP